jgi:hypothetical protein
MKHLLIDKHFGTADAYASALTAVVKEGVPDKHMELLRAHFEAPQHTATAQQLARAVGYKNYRSVDLQYGNLAHRVARRLGVLEPPSVDGQRAWVFVLFRWADRVFDPNGNTRFVLRAPVIKALRRLGYPWAVDVSSSKRMEPTRPLSRAKRSRRRTAHS